jgi:Ca2+-transporting ATPase
VPGDLVILSEGQKVPADMTLEISARPCASTKARSAANPFPSTVPPSGEEGAVFMGTLIVGGRGEGCVIATGGTTRFGQIAELTRSGGKRPRGSRRSCPASAVGSGVWG